VWMSPVTLFTGCSTWGRGEHRSPCSCLCTFPAEPWGCRGHVAAQPLLLLRLLSLRTSKSSIAHMPLGCFSWSGVFSSAWMVLLGSRWPAQVCGLPAGTSPGLHSRAAVSGSHAARREGAAGLIFPPRFGSCYLPLFAISAPKSRGKRSYLVKVNSKHFIFQ